MPWPSTTVTVWDATRVTVPSEVEPSPQLISAMKSFAVSAALVSRKPATGVPGASATPSVAEVVTGEEGTGTLKAKLIRSLTSGSNTLAKLTSTELTRLSGDGDHTSALLAELAVAELEASSASVTVTGSAPAIAYVCEPDTVKLPLAPLTVPVEVVPSPQSMLAVKSLATLRLSLSVKFATTLPSSATAVCAVVMVVRSA